MSCELCRLSLDTFSCRERFGKARDNGTLLRKTLLDIIALVIGKLPSQEPHIAIDVALMSAQVREISFSHEYSEALAARRSAACLVLPVQEARLPEPSRTMSLQVPGYSFPKSSSPDHLGSRPASAVKINNAGPRWIRERSRTTPVRDGYAAILDTELLRSPIRSGLQYA